MSTHTMLKTSEVAKRLRITTTRVAQLCAEGKIKAYRTGGDSGHWRIPEESLLLVSQQSTTGPEKSKPVAADRSVFRRVERAVK